MTLWPQVLCPTRRPAPANGVSYASAQTLSSEAPEAAPAKQPATGGACGPRGGGGGAPRLGWCTAQWMQMQELQSAAGGEAVNESSNSTSPFDADSGIASTSTAGTHMQPRVAVVADASPHRAQHDTGRFARADDSAMQAACAKPSPNATTVEPPGRGAAACGWSASQRAPAR